MVSVPIVFIDFFKWVLSTSAMATILVGLILLVKMILKNKLKPRWHYIIWLLVILRLILPWMPESSFSVFNLFPFGKNHESAMMTQNAEVKTPEKDFNSTEMNLSNGGELIGTNPISEFNTRPLKSQQSQNNHISIIFQMLFLLWITGVSLLGTYTILINRRFNLKMRKQTSITNQNIIYLFEKCKEELSIKKSILLIQSDEMSSPTLFGLLRPRMILPKFAVQTLSCDELRYIFLHEMAHVKRKDIAFNWLMNFLLILHWFNPILWYAYYRMREDQEIACDALALNYINPNESKDYAETIIKLVQRFSQPIQLPGMANISGNKKQLKRRIIMIKLFNKDSYRWSILGLSIVILLSGVALTNAKGAPEKYSQSTIQEKNGSPTSSSLDAEKSNLVEKVSQATVTDPKTQVLDKMSNSVDNFTTVKGKFIESYSTGIGTVEFQVHEGDKPASYVKNGSHETVYNVRLIMTKNNGIVERIDQTGDPIPASYYKTHPRVEIINGERHFTARRDPAMSGIAETVIAPEQNAFGFLEDYNLWSIQGDASLLGRTAIVVGGELSTYFKTKHKAEKFKMWIDKETGILLKRDEYDKEGKVTESIEVKELEINTKLDENLFQISKEMADQKIKEQAERRASQPRMTSGDIPIPDAIRSKWEAAKDEPAQTTIIQYDGKWYIYPKKGYLVDNIKVIGRQGTVILSQGGQKGTIPAVAENYNLDSLEPKN